MNPRTLPSSVLLLPLLLLASAASAFNITRILEQQPDFGSFNSYLSQTGLAEEINRRQTITVLAVSNSNISPISGLPKDELKSALAVHVVLDYYDDVKLHKLSKKTALLTTLYQTTGSATQQQGFLNVTQLASGDVVFGSAVKDAPLKSKLLKSVASKPYNISVLEVSVPILTTPASESPKASPPTSSSASPAPAPKHAKKKTPAAQPPKTSAETPAPSPSLDVADTPKADSPGHADTPKADAPGAADSPSPGGSPADEAKSSGSRAAAFGACGAVVLGIVAAVAAF